MHILIIEDEYTLAELIKEKLTKFTFYFKHKKGRKKLRPCTET